MTFDINGLVVPRFNEIIGDIQDDQIATIPTKFKYQDDKLIYQLNSVVARSLDQLAQLQEASFDALYISRAEGTNLEELCLLRKVFRLVATPSFTDKQFAWLTSGALIPTGTQFTSSISDDVAINTSPITGDPTNCAAATIVVNTAVNSAVYKVTINTVDYTYTADSSTTKTEIRDGILALITSGTPTGYSYVAEETDTIILTADTDENLNVSVSTTYLDISSVKVFFYVQLTLTGPTAVPSSTMNGINGAVSGFLSTNNSEEYTPGRSLETDAELRARALAGGDVAGIGTVLNIEAEIAANVPGVIYVDVIENTETSPEDSDGRPIYSFETVVLGGTDLAVGEELWRVKGASCRTWGNTTQAITDSSGTARTVYFSRPTPVQVAVRVQYSTYPEETLPSGAVDDIKAAVVAAIIALPIGKDVIAERLYSTVYGAVTGLGRTVINTQVLAASGDAPVTLDWDTAVIPVGSVEYASMELVDVYVSVL